MKKRILEKCPMCKSNRHNDWIKIDSEGFQTVICDECSLVYVKNPPTKEALDLYYSNYLNDVHQHKSDLVAKREKMYELELNFLLSFKKSGTVLDVGCSGGNFLNHFSRNGFECHGVEYGDAAFNEASTKFKLYFGELPDINIEHKYDIIVFRGVIEHLVNPTDYFDKAKSLLKKDGIIFITATPNRDSATFNLFKEDWNMHYPHEHLIHFNSKDLVDYFSNKGLKYYSEKSFYLESPYVNFENDLKLVLEKKSNPKSSVVCPPFFDNMMTLILGF